MNNKREFKHETPIPMKNLGLTSEIGYIESNLIDLSVIFRLWKKYD